MADSGLYDPGLEPDSGGGVMGIADQAAGGPTHEPDSGCGVMGMADQAAGGPMHEPDSGGGVMGMEGDGDNITMISFLTTHKTAHTWQCLKEELSLGDAQLAVLLLQCYEDKQSRTACSVCQCTLQQYCPTCSPMVSSSAQDNHAATPTPTPTTPVSQPAVDLPKESPPEGRTRRLRSRTPAQITIKREPVETPARKTRSSTRLTKKSQKETEAEPPALKVEDDVEDSPTSAGKNIETINNDIENREESDNEEDNVESENYDSATDIEDGDYDGGKGNVDIKPESTDSSSAPVKPTPKERNPGDIVACLWCDVSFKTVVALAKHIQEHMTAAWQRQNVPGGACRKAAKNEKIRKSLEMSIKQKSSGVTSDDSDTQEESLENAKEYTCYQCKISWKTPGGLSVHLQSSHFKTDACECLKCNTTFKSLRGVAFHMKTHPYNYMVRPERDPATHPHQCGQCGLRFMHAGVFATHVQRHAGASQVWCSQCQRPFKSVVELTGHHCQPGADPGHTDITAAAVNSSEQSSQQQLMPQDLQQNLVPQDTQQNLMPQDMQQHLMPQGSQQHVMPQGSEQHLMPQGSQHLMPPLASLNLTPDNIQGLDNDHETINKADLMKLTDFNLPLGGMDDTGNESHAFDQEGTFNQGGEDKAAMDLSSEIKNNIVLNTTEANKDTFVEPSNMPRKRGRKPKKGKLERKKPMKDVVRPYKCPDCPATFLYEGVLKLHSQKHTGQNSFPCSECDLTFRSKAQLYKHQERDHWHSSPIICKDCGKSFAGAKHLAQHRVLHTGERPYKCEICSESFAYGTYLSRHRRIHRPSCFKCKECGAEFYIKSDYNNHMNEHSDTNANLCSHCGQSFNTPAKLRQHVVRHGEKQFVCELCGKGFHQIGEHRMHMLTHQAVKPYPCKLCDRSFVSRAKLKFHHSQIHLQLKPHVCQQCNAAFATLAHLKDHFSYAHTTDRPWACHLCHSRFAAKRFYRLHLSRIHKVRSTSLNLDKKNLPSA